MNNFQTRYQKQISSDEAEIELKIDPNALNSRLINVFFDNSKPLQGLIDSKKNHSVSNLMS